MSRTLPLAVIVVAGLAACQTPPQTGGPAQPMPNIVTNVYPYTPGNGVVQSVMPTPTMAGAGSSSEPMRPGCRTCSKVTVMASSSVRGRLSGSGAWGDAGT